MTFSPAHPFDLPLLPPATDLEHPQLLKALLAARVELGELKGFSAALPNPMILLSPAIVRESVASSGIENIRTTVESALQQELFPEPERREEDKEVLRYSNAVRWGLAQLSTLPISSRLITGIQRQLLPNNAAGFRSTPNWIVDAAGQPVYTPPRAADIPRLLSNWETFINQPNDSLDPLLRCAISHYQFEAIHPFGDGNGRTGRILMVLHLVQEELLAQPTLFISGYINRYRSTYYRLLLEVSSHANWLEFLLFMLAGFQQQARETKEDLLAIIQLSQAFKLHMRERQLRVPLEMAELVFAHPVTTPLQAGREIGVHYKTASRHLAQLAAAGLLEDRQVGRYHFYLNRPLLDRLNRT